MSIEEVLSHTDCKRSVCCPECFKNILFLSYIKTPFIVNLACCKRYCNCCHRTSFQYYSNFSKVGSFVFCENSYSDITIFCEKLTIINYILTNLHPDLKFVIFNYLLDLPYISSCEEIRNEKIKYCDMTPFYDMDIQQLKNVLIKRNIHFKGKTKNDYIQALLKKNQIESPAAYRINFTDSSEYHDLSIDQLKQLIVDRKIYCQDTKNDYLNILYKDILVNRYRWKI